MRVNLFFFTSSYESVYLKAESSDKNRIRMPGGKVKPNLICLFRQKSKTAEREEEPRYLGNNTVLFSTPTPKTPAKCYCQLNSVKSFNVTIDAHQSSRDLFTFGPRQAILCLRAFRHDKF